MRVENCYIICVANTIDGITFFKKRLIKYTWESNDGKLVGLVN